MSETYIEYLLETCDDEELVNQMIDQFLENKQSNFYFIRRTSMKEYRIMAYFTQVYTPRSYKRKIVDTLCEANKLLEEAKEYYSSDNYRKYLRKVVIESREVSEWR